MNKDTLLQRALATQDTSKLLNLVNEAVEIIKAQDAMIAFRDKRVTDLREQNKVLQGQIENLEKTLWGRK